MTRFRMHTGRSAEAGGRGASRTFTRRVVTGFVVAAAFLGLSLVTAGPATASTYGNWLTYGNTNPITASSGTWVCGSSKDISPHVVAQVCAIRSSSGSSTQSAVIVRNNRGSTFLMDAESRLWNSVGGNIGYWFCRAAHLPKNAWTVCFGETLSYSSAVQAAGSAYNVGLTTSPWI